MARQTKENAQGDQDWHQAECVSFLLSAYVCVCVCLGLHVCSLLSLQPWYKVTWREDNPCQHSMHFLTFRAHTHTHEVIPRVVQNVIKSLVCMLKPETLQKNKKLSGEASFFSSHCELYLLFIIIVLLKILQHIMMQLCIHLHISRSELHDLFPFFISRILR